MDSASKPRQNPKIGLCEICSHSATVTSERGSVFHLCELSKIDPTFEKYPRLPVLHCTGFIERESNPPNQQS